MHHALETRRHIDAIQFSEPDDLKEVALFVDGGERAEEQNYDHGQAENVGAIVVFLRGELLGRTEQFGTHALAEILGFLIFLGSLGLAHLLLDAGFPKSGLPCESKVDQFALVPVIEKEVMQLDVSVDDPLAVDVAESLRHLQGQLQIAFPMAFPSIYLLSALLKSSLIDVGLQVHFTWLGEHVELYLFVVDEALSVTEEWLAGAGVGRLVYRRILFLLGGVGPKYEAVGAT